MMTKILDGRSIAQTIYDSLTPRIAALRMQPGLGVVMIGERADSQLYVRLKERAAQSIGIAFECQKLPARADHTMVRAAIQSFNSRPDIHGIIVQLPLPDDLDSPSILAMVDKQKDVDGLHPTFQQEVRGGTPTSWLPALDESILSLLKATGAGLHKQRVLIIANSPEFRATLSAVLRQRGAFVDEATDITMAQPFLPHANIVISALGIPRAIQEQDLASESIMIDCGIARDENGKLVGDFAVPHENTRIASYSPVPGGVGPVTVACLLANTVSAAEMQLQD